MKVLAVAILGASVALAACGSSNSSSNTKAETDAAQAAPATTLTPTSTVPSTPASTPRTAILAPESEQETPISQQRQMTPSNSPQTSAETDGTQQQPPEKQESLPYLLKTIGVPEPPPFTEDVISRLESLASMSETACEEWLESLDPDIPPTPECEQAYADLCQAMNETAEYDDAPEIWGDAARMVCLSARMVSSDLKISEDTIDCLHSSSERCQEANRSLCDNYEELAEELEYLSAALPAAEITEDYVAIVELVREVLCLGWQAR